MIEGGKYALMSNRFGVVASNPKYNVVWDLHQKENKSSLENKEGILVVQEQYGFPEAEVLGGTQSMRRYVPAWWNNYIKDPDGVRGTIDTIHCWYPFPYYKVYVEDEERPQSPWGGHSDWYLFRLAETYLLRAEAYVWLNQSDKAAEDVNRVRERAKAALASPAEMSIEYILDERARELFAEEFRKTELTRIAYIMADNNLNGYSIHNFSEKNYWYDRVIDKNEFYRAGNIMWGSNVFKLSSFHVLWPIPATAIDSNSGGVINQNEGYIGVENNQAPLTVIDDRQ